MKILLTTFAMVSFGLMAQNQLLVKGKMVNPSENYTQLSIVSNLTDTTNLEIKGKRFKLPIMDSNKHYELAFTNGEQTKSIKLEPKKTDKISVFYLQVNWIK
jgi:hypothetical protein